MINAILKDLVISVPQSFSMAIGGVVGIVLAVFIIVEFF